MFLSHEPLLLSPESPFSTVTGLKDDRKKAGYEPEIIPTISPSPSNEGIITKLSK